MSARYKEYKELDFAKIASEVLTFWEENKIFEESITRREGKPTFTFYEGPPSANGTPGIHHVMARTVKDIFCRFKTFEGYQVKRKGGWDTHGLPVELQVEKELGITKDDIGIKISVEDYNKKCRETVMKYKNQWNDLTVKMGYWVDLEHPYVTYENDYIESLWWLLKQLYEKGLLYKGYSIQPYSPTDGTGLSSHELNLPGCYKDVKDTSITAQFKVVKDSQSSTLFDGDEELFILAWTTTPWTLPGNCALAVGEKIEYVKVKTYNAYTFKPVSVILAKERLSAYFDQKGAEADFENYKPGDKVVPYKVVGSYSGRDLLGAKYEQLLPYVKPEGKAFVVIAGDFVSTEDGTGIVHTASLFGADDFRVCKENNISAITVKDELGNDVPVVNKQGKFVKEI
ncbi:MAG TPA: class I tRNA ligase family protein, partial [Cyclobacteriaceae bacterium]|nr:class I tRNA ligase family protein [Cyclobacteriaceae bacterium]